MGEPKQFNFLQQAQTIYPKKVCIGKNTKYVKHLTKLASDPLEPNPCF